MKREEKNQQTRRKIVDSALAEFAQQGYGGSSVNAICAAQGVSKGIIYHYFASKDELYLCCVEECFRLLTEHLRACDPGREGPAQKQLEAYFACRMDFFRTHPVYQPIFCEAVVTPPAHLQEEIQARRQGFDRLNAAILEGVLEPLPLRRGMARADVVEVVRQLQDFINARYRVAPMTPEEFRARDESCRQALDILLYGIVERTE
ncbi:MAG: TetR/AcrR family transcriptional regulator [Aristaeellaceae bacterium]